VIVYGLRGANGDLIEFDGVNYVLEPGMIGFGVPPVSVRIDPSARDGGLFRHSRREPRNVDLPVVVLGADWRDVEAKARRLGRILQDTSGPTELINYRNSGNLTLKLHYVAGAEGQYGEEQGGKLYLRWLVSFQAPQPYWETEQSQSFTIQTGNIGRGLLPKLTRLRLVSGQTLGTIPVQNRSDVQTFPVWTITGPLDDFQVQYQGLSFTIPEVEDGDVITVDTEAGTVRDQTGANRYSLLGPAPKLFAFPPGDFEIQVGGQNPTADTRVEVSYPLRFEVVHR